MATTLQTPARAALTGQQITWSSSDYARIGTTLVIMGELLREAADLGSGQHVLDVATGSGNTVLSAARRFCAITGIGDGPSLPERASERTEGSPIALAATPTRTDTPDRLTRREQQVVAQIAQGKGNREIAAALFIAEKTVEMHITHSLSKLGFNSRSQVAVWAYEQARTS